MLLVARVVVYYSLSALVASESVKNKVPNQPYVEHPLFTKPNIFDKVNANDKDITEQKGPLNSWDYNDLDVSEPLQYNYKNVWWTGTRKPTNHRAADHTKVRLYHENSKTAVSYPKNTLKNDTSRKTTKPIQRSATENGPNEVKGKIPNEITKDKGGNATDNNDDNIKKRHLYVFKKDDKGPLSLSVKRNNMLIDNENNTGTHISLQSDPLFGDNISYSEFEYVIVFNKTNVTDVKRGGSAGKTVIYKIENVDQIPENIKDKNDFKIVIEAGKDEEVPKEFVTTNTPKLTSKHVPVKLTPTQATYNGLLRIDIPENQNPTHTTKTVKNARSVFIPVENFPENENKNIKDEIISANQNNIDKDNNNHPKLKRIDFSQPYNKVGKMNPLNKYFSKATTNNMDAILNAKLTATTKPYGIEVPDFVPGIPDSFNAQKSIYEESKVTKYGNVVSKLLTMGLETSGHVTPSINLERGSEPQGKKRQGPENQDIMEPEEYQVMGYLISTLPPPRTTTTTTVNGDHTVPTGGMVTTDVLELFHTDEPYIKEHEVDQFVRDCAKQMQDLNMGFFSVFLIKLFESIAMKNDSDVAVLCAAAEREADILLMQESTLNRFGQPFEDKFAGFARTLKETPPDAVKGIAVMLHHVMVNRRTGITRDINSVLDYIDEMYDEYEGIELLRVSEKIRLYPTKDLTASQLHRDLSEALYRPLKRLKDTTQRQILFDSVNQLLENRMHPPHVERRLYFKEPNKNFNMKHLVPKTTPVIRHSQIYETTKKKYYYFQEHRNKEKRVQERYRRPDVKNSFQKVGDGNRWKILPEGNRDVNNAMKKKAFRPVQESKPNRIQSFDHKNKNRPEDSKRNKEYIGMIDSKYFDAWGNHVTRNKVNKTVVRQGPDKLKVLANKIRGHDKYEKKIIKSDKVNYYIDQEVVMTKNIIDKDKKFEYGKFGNKFTHTESIVRPKFQKTKKDVRNTQSSAKTNKKKDNYFTTLALFDVSDSYEKSSVETDDNVPHIMPKEDVSDYANYNKYSVKSWNYDKGPTTVKTKDQKAVRYSEQKRFSIKSWNFNNKITTEKEDIKKLNAVTFAKPKRFSISQSDKELTVKVKTEKGQEKAIYDHRGNMTARNLSWYEANYGEADFLVAPVDENNPIVPFNFDRTTGQNNLLTTSNPALSFFEHISESKPKFSYKDSKRSNSTLSNLYLLNRGLRHLKHKHPGLYKQFVQHRKRRKHKSRKKHRKLRSGHHKSKYHGKRHKHGLMEHYEALVKHHLRNKKRSKFRTTAVTDDTSENDGIALDINYANLYDTVKSIDNKTPMISPGKSNFLKIQPPKTTPKGLSIMFKNPNAQLNNLWDRRPFFATPMLPDFRMKNRGDAGNYLYQNKLEQRPKIQEATSYSNEEYALRFNLNDAIRHEHFNIKALRRFNDVEMTTKDPIKELSSYSSEEIVLKSNIYKAVGFNDMYRRANFSDIVKPETGKQKFMRSQVGPIDEYSYSDDEELLKGKLNAKAS